jgi:FkbM family methyltransferase
MRNQSAFFIEKIGNHFDFEFILRSKTAKLRDMVRLPIRAVIDIGANDGGSAKRFVKAFPGCQVYCFEPLPGPFGKLSRWAERQKGRVKVFNLALGEKEGEQPIFVTVNYDPASSLLKSTQACHGLYPFTREQKPLVVRIETLDSVIAHLREPLLPELLIKVDTQGYDNRVIKGGLQTFRKAGACIIEMCLDTLYEQQASFDELMGLLKNAGFHYAGSLEQSYADDGHVIFVDGVFLK